ncbi:MAG: ADP-ribosylglycohydrolase family protein, partial [Bacteroidota bacterium]
PYDSLTFTRTMKAYEMLRENHQEAPFHAGEIHLINLTAILFCGADFKRAMEFVVNYGRDNDTVAAITGAIIGAHVGGKGLPQEQLITVLQVNREELGIDLEDLATKLTKAILNRRGES